MFAGLNIPGIAAAWDCINVTAVPTAVLSSWKKLLKFAMALRIVVIPGLVEQSLLRSLRTQGC